MLQTQTGCVNAIGYEGVSIVVRLFVQKEDYDD